MNYLLPPKKNEMLRFALERTKELGHDMAKVSHVGNLHIYECRSCRRHIEVWDLPPGVAGDPLTEPCTANLKIQVPVP